MSIRTASGKSTRNPDGQMPLMEHLAELRDRVVKSLLAVVLCSVVGYVLYDRIFRFFVSPYCRAVIDTDRSCRLYSFDLLNGFMLRMKVAMVAGLLLALPVILYQIWRFIVPALYENERRYTIAFVGSSTVLFGLGGVLAFYTLPPMIAWLQGAGGNVTYITAADKYFWLTAIMIAAFGLGFEFPIVLVALQMVGILEPTALAGVRRQAFCGIVVAVAVLTPGGDPISLVALSGPMYILYEISILLGRLIVRRRVRAAT